MVSALDRFGMAQALVQAGADVVFGDFIFALDLDRPVRGLGEFEEMARKYLPDACKLPFQFFYPTGKKQDRAPQPKYPEYYEDPRSSPATTISCGSSCRSGSTGRRSSPIPSPPRTSTSCATTGSRAW